jgi:signal peptidase I
LTTNGLIVLIGILSIARGVFLLFPRMQVRAVWVKLFLMGGLCAVAWYLMQNAPPQHDVVDAPFPPMRYTVVVLIALLGILLLPSGEDPEPMPVGEPDGDGAPSVPAPRPLAEILLGSMRRVWTEQQKKTMLEYMDSVIIAGITALFLIWYVVRSFYIPSESMVPTLQINDMILVDEVAYRFYRPGRGDIVVFHPPERARSEGKDFIKRIVAVEGDTVQVKNDITYINGRPIDEPYRHPGDPDNPFSRDFEPITVPPGHVFCMGDNRANSEDSRYWGTLPVENIIGKAFLIFYPLDRIRLLH